jgi:hypothetical protein
MKWGKVPLVVTEEKVYGRWSCIYDAPMINMGLDGDTWLNLHLVIEVVHGVDDGVVASTFRQWIWRNVVRFEPHFAARKGSCLSRGRLRILAFLSPAAVDRAPFQ